MWKPLIPKISKAQLTELWTIASKKGWTNAGVHTFIEIQFKLRSTKDLTVEQYEKVCEAIGSSLLPDEATIRDENTADLFGFQEKNHPREPRLD